MQTPFLRPIENHHLHWFNMTQSSKHDTIPQCIGSLAGITLIGDQYVPGVYLLFWRPSWIWHQDDPPPPHPHPHPHPPQQTETET